MGKLFGKNTPFNFIQKNTLISYNEYKCKCSRADCLFTVIHDDIVNGVSKFRKEYKNIELIVTSAFRCQHYNKAVMGKSNSQHLIGCAVDILIPQKMDVEEFTSKAQKIFPFVIAYPKFIHCDLRYGRD